MSGMPNEELDSDILDDVVALGGYCIKNGLHSYEEWASYLRKDLEQGDNPKFEAYLKEAWRRLLPFHRELINPSPPTDLLSPKKSAPTQPHPLRPDLTKLQQKEASPINLQNRYRIIRQLGQGGMGAVYEAFDSRLSRTVALKKTLAETEELRRAFEREARLLANLNHPSLPRVIDHFTEGQEQYLVMDYIPGDDLKTLMKKRGKPLSAEEIMKLADDLLETLGYLHGHEPPIIHRDIKPANLKLTETGKIVLLDFGLAKGTAGQMASVTSSRSVYGFTPHFASLEQMQGERTTVRSDLYSLAATLYYLLTGVIPPDALARATSIINDEPDPLLAVQNLHRDAPESLMSALMSALSLKPTQRPQSAAEMRSILRRGIDDSGTSITVKNTPEQKKIFSYKSFYGWVIASTLVLSVIPYIAGASINTILLLAVMPVAVLITLAGLGLCFVLIEEEKLKKTSALLTWALLFSLVVVLYFQMSAVVSALSYPLLVYCLMIVWIRWFSRT